jgi:uncharacterized protein YbjT (DUF2867 family)
VRIGSRSGTPPFNWEDESTWEGAVRGVQSAYVTYYPDLAFPGAADKVLAFARVAVDSGVRRLVLPSGRNEPGALLGEQAVRESGAEWTIVRSAFMNQNFNEGFWVDSLLAGELAAPAGDVGEPFIDADDIADIVAAALTEDRHVGQIYEVTGPRLLTFGEAVNEIAAASGRQIGYVPITPQEFAAALIDAGVPEDFATDLTDLFSQVLDGRSSYLTDGVQRALGRGSRDFADYAREAAATGVWSVPAKAGTAAE